MDSTNDVALYSGLGAGIIAVAILVVAVMLYRKNHSEYGVDVIDSSALTGGFQSFNFKTTRQGKRECHQIHTDISRHPRGQKPASLKTSAAWPPQWLMAFVCIEQHGVLSPYLPRIYTSIISERICPSILTDLLLCYCEEGDNQSLIDTSAAPSPPHRPHIWLSGNQSPPSDYTGLSHWWINVRGMEQWTSIQFLLCTAITSVGYVTAAVPASLATGIHITVTDTSGLAQVIAIVEMGDPSSLPWWQQREKPHWSPHCAPGSPKAWGVAQAPSLVSRLKGCEENVVLGGGMGRVYIQQVINPI